MEFKIRRLSKYLDVSVSEGDTTIILGLLGEAERVALVRILEEAVDELLSGLDIQWQPREK